MLDSSTRVRTLKVLRDKLVQETGADRDVTLVGFGLGPVVYSGFFDTEDAVLDRLTAADDDKLIDLANHYGLETRSATEILLGSQHAPTLSYDEPLRLFVSHLETYREDSAKITTELERYGINGFLAHKDIPGGADWKDELRRNLNECHAGLALLHDGYNNSVWCQQEVGWLAAREVPIIRLKYGQAAPPGFLGDIQAFSALNKGSEVLGLEIVKFLVNDPRTQAHLTALICNKLTTSWSFNNTDFLVLSILSMNTRPSSANAHIIYEALVHNGQVSGAFISQSKRQMARQFRAKLEGWFPEGDPERDPALTDKAGQWLSVIPKAA